MDEKKLQTLLDRMDIVDTSIRYATGVDMRDWEIYRSCFTDELEVDFTGTPETQKADDWVNTARQLVSPYTATQHIITNHNITIEGDEATCIAYLQAQHYRSDDTGVSALTVGGYYTNKLVRSPEGWKISKLKLTITWTLNS